MSEAREKRERIPFEVYEDERNRINELVKGRDEKFITDYLRRLIEEDAARQKKPFKFRVDRGGDRRKDSDALDDSELLDPVEGFRRGWEDIQAGRVLSHEEFLKAVGHEGDG